MVLSVSCTLLVEITKSQDEEKPEELGRKKGRNLYPRGFQFRPCITVLVAWNKCHQLFTRQAPGLSICSDMPPLTHIRFPHIIPSFPLEHLIWCVIAWVILCLPSSEHIYH